MNQLIKKMSYSVQRERGYGQNGYELAVHITYNSALFDKIKKSEDPLAASMSQIKNVVWGALGVRGLPSYSPVSYNQRFPRASRGEIRLTVYFDISKYTAKEVESLKPDLNAELERTRDQGHLFAVTAIASKLAN